MKKTLAFVLLCLMQVAAVSAQESNVVKSTGHIGPYEVTMFIDTDYTKEGDEVGYYYYNDRPNTHFKLVMREYTALNAQGTMLLVLDERSPKGKRTGTFRGNKENRGGGYEGTFTNSKGQKYKFELMEE